MKKLVILFISFITITLSGCATQIWTEPQKQSIRSIKIEANPFNYCVTCKDPKLTNPIELDSLVLADVLQSKVQNKLSELDFFNNKFMNNGNTHLSINVVYSNIEFDKSSLKSKYIMRTMATLTNANGEELYKLTIFSRSKTEYDLQRINNPKILRLMIEEAQDQFVFFLKESMSRKL